MKKKYVTPMIAVEHYELTQTIAACSIRIGFAGTECVESDPDSPPALKDVAQWYFTNSKDCFDVPSNDDMLDGICYHTSANAAFTS